MSIVERCFVCLFVLFAYFSVNFSLYSNHVACTPSFCGCVFPDGFGIEMKKLIRFNFTMNETDVQFNLKLCSNVIIENSTNCSSTSLFIVQYNGTNITTCQNLGTSKDSTFIWEQKADLPYLKYVNDNITSEVHLICDESPENQFLHIENSVKPYLFNLKSKEVCPKYITTPGGGGGGGGKGGGGEGSHIVAVLAIIILVVFLLYMIVGMLVLKFIRGADGIEIIPNHEFWTSIPTRMKNLLLFCVAGCKNPPTYDRI